MVSGCVSGDGRAACAAARVIAMMPAFVEA
jgi:hypothetical protein